MGIAHAHEHDTHELGGYAAISLLMENTTPYLTEDAIRARAENAYKTAVLAVLDMDKRNAKEHEARWPDEMWCHWCDTWRETGIDGGGTLHRRCVECGHEIRCDDCSQRVSAEGWCTTKGCPQNPIYSP